LWNIKDISSLHNHNANIHCGFVNKNDKRLPLPQSQATLEYLLGSSKMLALNFHKVLLFTIILNSRKGYLASGGQKAGNCLAKSQENHL